MFTNKSIIEIILTLLVFLFLYTGLSKYFDIYHFKTALVDAPLLKPFANVIAILLPGLEIVVVILLTIPATRIIGLWLSIVLLSIFSLYLTYMVSFSKILPCGCGGVISQLSWKGHILFNLFFLSISIIALRLENKKHRREQSSRYMASV